MPRAIKLSKERQKTLLRDLEDTWDEVRSDWASWCQNLPRWVKSYRGFVDPKTSPWPGCSNLSIPITAIATERLHSTYMGMIDDPEGLIDITPTEFGDVSRVDGLRAFANHVFFQEMKLPQELDPFAHGTCMYGQQGLITVWRKRQRMTRECWPVAKSELSKRRDAAAFATWFYQNDLLSVTRKGAEKCEANFLKDNRRRTATITRLRDEERLDPAEDELEFEVETLSTVMNRPTVELPAPEDLLWTADGKGPQDASALFYNFWMTLAEIEEYKDQNYYAIDKELLERLQKDHAGRSSASDKALSSDARTYDEEVSSVKTRSAMRRDRILVQKVFMAYDADDDGRQEECIFTLLWDSGGSPHYLRGDYLESVFPHRQRPATICDFIKIPRLPIAIGVPEYLNAVQIAVNTTHNQIVDAATLRNNPFWLYNSGSSMAPKTMRVSPGAGIPIDNTANVVFPTFGGSGMELFNVSAGYADLAERMVPHGDVVMGRGSGGNRTAQGMAMLVQQSQQVWDKYIKRFGVAIESVANQALQLYGAYMEPWKEFRVTGTNQIQKISRDDLREGFDFHIRASVLRANREIQRSYAAMRFQMLVAHPMFQSPARQYELVRDLYESQEVKNIEQKLGPRPEESLHAYISPEQENGLFAQSIPWEPHADEDFETHIQVHQAFLATAGRFLDQKRKALVHTHMEHTKQLMSIKQRQTQQQAMGIQPGVEQPDFGQMAGQQGPGNAIQQMPGVDMNQMMGGAGG